MTDAAVLRVSVIIPTCDRPLLLRRALRSVAAQTIAPAEVIVVNDGPHVCDEIAPDANTSADVRLIPNHRREGVSGARNSGAERACGDLLAFLDDDDEWAPTYLAAILDLCGAAEADLVCTDLMLRLEDGSERLGKRAPDLLAADAFLTRNPGLVGSNLVVRRTSYLAAGGFDETILGAEDMDFGVRMSLREDVRYAALHVPLVYHHIHDGRRICTRRGAAIRSGMRRFFELHQHRMSDAQRAAFRGEAIRYWGVDEYGTDVD